MVLAQKLITRGEVKTGGRVKVQKLIMEGEGCRARVIKVVELKN